MKVRVLGCSGAELPNFSPPAFLIDNSILLDAGTTTARLNESEQRKIRHILTTHSHLDHIRGIPSLADNMILKNRKHRIILIGIREVLQTVGKNLFNNVIWPDFTKIPSHKHPVLSLKIIRAGRRFKINNLRVTAEKVNHSVTAVGYIIESSDGKRLIYTGDSGPTSRLWKTANRETKTKAIDAVIIEITFPNSMREKAVTTGHFTPAMLSDELKKLKVPPKKIFITHIKPQFLNTISGELRRLKLNNLKILKQGKTYVI